MFNTSTAKEFAADIIARNYNTNSYIDAILEYCHHYGLEPETVAPLVNKNKELKNLLREEAGTLHFLKKAD